MLLPQLDMEITTLLLETHGVLIGAKKDMLELAPMKDSLEPVYVVSSKITLGPQLTEKMIRDFYQI
jgi:hypothetical protein